jgi:hypothetical protein
MRIPKYLIVILILFFYVNIASIEPAFDSSGKSRPKLEDILKKCAEYCEKIKGSALFFICQEKIKEEFTRFSEGMTSAVVTSSGGQRSIRIRRMPGPKQRNEYVYDYQLVKKGSKIRESRTLIEENGEERNEKNAPLKTKRFYSLRSVYGPVGLLSRKFQAQYDYKLKKEDKIEGRKVYIIEAAPKKEIEGKPNYGKLWVDKENFSVLKIEMSQESLAGYEDFVKKIKKQRIKPIFKTVHYYGVEVKGIRFPSKTVFTEVYRPFRGTVSKTEIEYSHYKFFTVDVEVKYREDLTRE